MVCANAVENLLVVSVDDGVAGRPPMASPPLMTSTGSATKSSHVYTCTRGRGAALVGGMLPRTGVLGKMRGVSVHYTTLMGRTW